MADIELCEKCGLSEAITDSDLCAMCVAEIEEAIGDIMNGSVDTHPIETLWDQD